MIRIASAFVAFAMFAAPAAAQTKPAPKPCSLSILKTLGNFETFVAQIKACGASDAAAALKDAQDGKDLEAQACLSPLNDVAQAAQKDDGSTGLLYAMQKYRDARRSGMITACANYFNSTFGLGQ